MTKIQANKTNNRNTGNYRSDQR